jgi:mRNA-degrading endonuclease RelE of RelBE toxin-antitoxin system
MRYSIILAAEAVEDLNELKANVRAEVKDGMETHLRYEPTKASKSRIKRLRGFTKPQYRLRINDVRVFYDVAESTVEVLAIIEKSMAEQWLERHGKR